MRQERERGFDLTCWRLRDRLSERDVVRLVMASKTGIATKEIADRYSINVKSARKLLRQRGERECREATRQRRHLLD